MAAHLLTVNPAGIPKLETFNDKDQLQTFYGGHPMGRVLSSASDLVAAKEYYVRNGWVMDLLEKIDAQAFNAEASK